jgi:hypothetical protein
MSENLLIDLVAIRRCVVIERQERSILVTRFDNNRGRAHRIKTCLETFSRLDMYVCLVNKDCAPKMAFFVLFAPFPI